MERGRGLPHTHSPLVRGRPGRATLSQHRAAAEGSGQGRSCCPQWARPRPARLGTDRSSRSAMQFSRVRLSICPLNCRPELNSSPLGGLGVGGGAPRTAATEKQSPRAQSGARTEQPLNSDRAGTFATARLDLHLVFSSACSVASFQRCFFSKQAFRQPAWGLPRVGGTWPGVGGRHATRSEKRRCGRGLQTRRRPGPFWELQGLLQAELRAGPLRCRLQNTDLRPSSPFCRPCAQAHGSGWGHGYHGVSPHVASEAQAVSFTP